MKTSSLIREAIEHLWNGMDERGAKATTVCAAVHMASNNHREVPVQWDEALAIRTKVNRDVMDALHPHSSIDRLLVASGEVVDSPDNPVYPMWQRSANREFIQMRRLAFMENMVAAYESKGD